MISGKDNGEKDKSKKTMKKRSTGNAAPKRGRIWCEPFGCAAGKVALELPG